MGGLALLRARMKGGEGRPARVRPVTTLPCGGGGGGGDSAHTAPATGQHGTAPAFSSPYATACVHEAGAAAHAKRLRWAGEGTRHGGGGRAGGWVSLKRGRAGGQAGGRPVLACGGGGGGGRLAIAGTRDAPVTFGTRTKRHPHAAGVPAGVPAPPAAAQVACPGQPCAWENHAARARAPPAAGGHEVGPIHAHPRCTHTGCNCPAARAPPALPLCIQHTHFQLENTHPN